MSTVPQSGQSYAGTSSTPVLHKPVLGRASESRDLSAWTNAKMPGLTGTVAAEWRIDMRSVDRVVEPGAHYACLRLVLVTAAALAISIRGGAWRWWT